MQMTRNTILIADGASGIGLELARQLLTLGNAVIVTGRDAAELNAARAALPGLHVLHGDTSDPNEVRELHRQAIEAFPRINMLLNCAGVMRLIGPPRPGAQDSAHSLQASLNGTIWMSALLLPHLKQQPNAAIVNISSGSIPAASAAMPAYSATKSAIHAYTQSLRHQLRNTGVKVFELVPPRADTPLLHGEAAAPGSGWIKPMRVEAYVRKAIAGMRKNVPEIRPGMAGMRALAGCLAPDGVLRRIARSVDIMRAGPAAA